MAYTVVLNLSRGRPHLFTRTMKQENVKINLGLYVQACCMLEKIQDVVSCHYAHKCNLYQLRVRDVESKTKRKKKSGK